MNPAPGVLRVRVTFRQSMDIAIVTGAETPLGLRVIERLIEQGCRVHGIGNNFSQFAFADPQFVAHALDLTDLDAVRTTTEQILETEKRVHILVHAIDVTPGTAFRKLPLGNLEAILKIGLLGPVMMTRLLLPNLMRFHGQLINIIPTNKSGHDASAINALIEGGMRSMNNALFDQARDAGLRITNLLLRQNTELPPATASDEQLIQSRIDPEDVANTIERLLDPHVTNVPNEISLYPRLSAQASAELPELPEALDPYHAVVLPPKDYCPPEPEPIPTKQADSIERVIPYTDEEMEERIAAAIEEYEANPEQFENKLSDGEGQPNKKKRRRRRGRNRNKNRDDESGDQPSEESSQANEAIDDSQPATEHSAHQDAESSNEPSDGPKKSRRRRGGRNRNKKRDEQPDSTPEASEPKPVENQPKTENTSDSTDSTNKPKRRRGGRNRGRNSDLPELKEQSSAFDIAAEPVIAEPIVDTRTPQPIEPRSTPVTEDSKTEKPLAKKAAKKSSEKGSKESREEEGRQKAAKKTVAKEPLELSSEAAPATKKAAKKATKKAVKKKTAKKKAAKKAAKKKVVNSSESKGESE